MGQSDATTDRAVARQSHLDAQQTVQRLSVLEPAGAVRRLARQVVGGDGAVRQRPFLQHALRTAHEIRLAAQQLERV